MSSLALRRTTGRLIVRSETTDAGWAAKIDAVPSLAPTCAAAPTHTIGARGTQKNLKKKTPLSKTPQFPDAAEGQFTEHPLLYTLPFLFKTHSEH